MSSTPFLFFVVIRKNDLISRVMISNLVDRKVETTHEVDKCNCQMQHRNCLFKILNRRKYKKMFDKIKNSKCIVNINTDSHRVLQNFYITNRTCLIEWTHIVGYEPQVPANFSKDDFKKEMRDFAKKFFSETRFPLYVHEAERKSLYAGGLGKRIKYAPIEIEPNEEVLLSEGDEEDDELGFGQLEEIETESDDSGYESNEEIPIENPVVEIVEPQNVRQENVGGLRIELANVRDPRVLRNENRNSFYLNIHEHYFGHKNEILEDEISKNENSFDEDIIQAVVKDAVVQDDHSQHEEPAPFLQDYNIIIEDLLD